MRRPRVIAYVTREHPVTGADQLLVIEKDGELHVPAGGIEPGESPAEGAAREVREETGLDGIRVIRALGVVEQPGRLERGFVHLSHFLQAVATVDSADEWERGGVRVSWVQIAAELRLWAPHGELVHRLLRKRVVAYLTRKRDGRAELLIIEHGDIPDFVEVPAGRLDPDETLEEGLVREVEEETGVTGIRIVRELADADEFARLFGPGAHESHAFHAEADSDSDEWAHPVAGSGADAGMVHLCRWVPLAECPLLWGKTKPDPLVERLGRSI